MNDPDMIPVNPCLTPWFPCLLVVVDLASLSL